MTRHDVAAKFVADLQCAFEVEAGAFPQVDAVVRRSASSQASTSNQRAFEPASGGPVTVRQTPAQAIDAPMAIVSGS